MRKVQSANFMPKLSYSVVSFSRTDNAMVSPWGQAFSLLADITAFPRKALTDSFFLRGLKVPEDDLIEAMNVADDALSVTFEPAASRIAAKRLPEITPRKFQPHSRRHPPRNSDF